MIGLALNLNRCINASDEARALAAIRRLGGTLIYAPDNALGDGAPNLLTAPEFAAGLTDAPVLGGLVTLSSIAGYDNAIAFGHDGVAVSYAYKQVTATDGLTYTLSVIVKMDDGNAPSFGSITVGSPLNTFSLILRSDAVSQPPYIVENIGGGVFRVSCFRVMPDSAAWSNWGVVKYPTNDSRTFKVTGYKLEPGSVATAYTPQSVLRQRGVYVDNVGTTPVTAVGDLIGKMLDKTGTNHATQSAVASKPSLQRVNGRNVISFDGNNDFLQTGITTGNEGWICAGVNFTESNSTIVCSGAGSNAQKGIWAYRTASNDGVNMLVGNGTLVSNAVARPMPANTPCVWEGWWTATTVGQAVDGVGATDAARSGDASPPPAPLIIGAYTAGVTYAANGGISVTVICPTLPPSADRALIRAWVAKQQGQTL